MQWQVDTNEHIRHNLLYAFNQDYNAAKTKSRRVYCVCRLLHHCGKNMTRFKSTKPSMILSVEQKNRFEEVIQLKRLDQRYTVVIKHENAHFHIANNE